MQLFVWSSVLKVWIHYFLHTLLGYIYYYLYTIYTITLITLNVMQDSVGRRYNLPEGQQSVQNSMNQAFMYMENKNFLDNSVPTMKHSCGSMMLQIEGKININLVILEKILVKVFRAKAYSTSEHSFTHNRIQDNARVASEQVCEHLW